MPTFHHPVDDRALSSIRATPTYFVFGESTASLKAQALPNGERALTPIVAGTVSGTLVVLGWFIAAVVIITKRRKRKKQLAKEGRLEEFNEAPKTEPFILPPDPAVVEGLKQPGEHIDIQEKPSKAKERKLHPPPLPPPRTKSLPAVEHMKLRDVFRSHSAGGTPPPSDDSQPKTPDKELIDGVEPHDFAYRSQTSTNRAQQARWTSNG